MRPLTDEEAVQINEELIKLSKKSNIFIFFYY